MINFRILRHPSETNIEWCPDSQGTRDECSDVETTETRFHRTADIRKQRYL